MIDECISPSPSGPDPSCSPDSCTSETNAERKELGIYQGHTTLNSGSEYFENFLKVLRFDMFYDIVV
jgi:hypothetical protein